MSRMKLWWRATMLGLGGVKLISACDGHEARYAVEISMTLDRNDRHVYVELDPSTARTMAAALKQSADRADELTKKMREQG